MLVIFGAALCVACGPRGGGHVGLVPEGAVASHAAIYRAEATGDDGRRRKFKLFVWTDGVDRAHAEVLPPIGGPAAIFDGNVERWAISFPREGVAYVGPADPRAMETLLSVPVEVRTWIDAILGREGVPGELVVDRVIGPPGYVQALTLQDGAARLELSLRQIRALPAPNPSLGTAQAGAGLEIRPLAALAAASHRVE